MPTELEAVSGKKVTAIACGSDHAALVADGKTKQKKELSFFPKNSPIDRSAGDDVDHHGNNVYSSCHLPK